MQNLKFLQYLAMQLRYPALLARQRTPEGFDVSPGPGLSVFGHGSCEDPGKLLGTRLTGTHEWFEFSGFLQDRLSLDSIVWVTVVHDVPFLDDFGFTQCA